MKDLPESVLKELLLSFPPQVPAHYTRAAHRIARLAWDAALEEAAKKLDRIYTGPDRPQVYVRSLKVNP